MESFEEFVAGSGRRLLTTAALLTQDRHRAEDLVQVALLKTWSSWDRIHTAPEAFARKVLVNAYVSAWRRRWNGERPTEQLPERSSYDADASANLDLRAALARLPRRQRAVIVLRYYAGLSDAEIATELGCRIGTVRSLASRALAQLRVEPALRREYGDPSDRGDDR